MELAGYVLNNLQSLTVAEYGEQKRKEGFDMAAFSLDSQDMARSERIAQGLKRRFATGTRQMSPYDSDVERLETLNEILLAGVTRNQRKCGLVGANVNPDGASYTLYSISMSGVELNKGVELPQAPGEVENSTVFSLSPGFGAFLINRSATYESETSFRLHLALTKCIQTIVSDHCLTN